jgi:hypothetical protein
LAFFAFLGWKYFCCQFTPNFQSDPVFAFDGENPAALRDLLFKIIHYVAAPSPDLTPQKGRDILRENFAMRLLCHYPLVAAAFFVAWCGAGRVFGAGDAAAGAAPVASAAPAGAPEVVDGYLKVGFDRLGSFPFVGDYSIISAAATEAQIPAAIKKLNGQKVIVTGFMLPRVMDDKTNEATEFMLLKTDPIEENMVQPKINEWVLVEMPKGVKPLMDVPISFRGKLRVGAIFEKSYLTGIYSLDGEKMAGGGEGKKAP